MILDISAVSDIGNVRMRNEDIILIKDEFVRDGAKNCRIEYDAADAPFLIAVADGMGGHRGGAVASEIVATEMRSAIPVLLPDLPVTDLKNALREKILLIHDRLNHEGADDPDKAGMGPTFTGLLFYGGALFSINIGDSRIYRLRDGILSRFTRDHSLSAMTHDPDAPKNVLVNSFGAGANIFFDFEDISSRVIPDDIFLLCSDGLTNELTDEDIEFILSKTNDAGELVSAANNKMGSDNISVVVIRFSGVME